MVWFLIKTRDVTKRRGRKNGEKQRVGEGVGEQRSWRMPQVCPAPDPIGLQPDVAPLRRFSVTAFYARRSRAMEALGPLRNGCTFHVRWPVGLRTGSKETPRRINLAPQLLPRGCRAN